MKNKYVSFATWRLFHLLSRIGTKHDFVPFPEIQHTLDVSHSRPNYKRVKTIDYYLISLLSLFLFFLISIYHLSESNSDQANELFVITLVLTFEDRKLRVDHAFTFLERKKIKELG